MIKRIINILWFLVAGCVALTSCTKNDSTTVALIGTEYYIDNILSVVPDSLQAKFFVDFGSIPSGYVPPKIEGSYVVNPKQRLCSNVENWPLQTIEPNVFMRFTKQHNGILTMELTESTETITDTVFVQGGGNNFVVYFIEDKEYTMEYNNHSYQVDMKRGVLMKGTMTANGFSDFKFATIIMEVEDNSGGLIGQYPRGSYFIYKDGDGMVDCQEW